MKKKEFKTSLNSHTLLYSRFPEVPTSEELVNDYVCALSSKGMLYQGRLYITPCRLCFYACVLGSVKRFSLHWTDVDELVKKNFGFLPHGIDIVSGTDTYSLRNFLNRDGAFEVLHREWTFRKNNLPTLKVNKLTLEEIERPLASPPISTPCSPHRKSPSVTSTWQQDNILSALHGLNSPRGFTGGMPLTPPRSELFVSPPESPLSQCIENSKNVGQDTESISIENESNSSFLKRDSEWTCMTFEHYTTCLPELWNILQGDEVIQVGKLLPKHPLGFTVAFLETFSSASNITKSIWTKGDGQELSSLKFEQVEQGNKRTLNYDISLASLTVQTQIVSKTHSSIAYISNSTSSGVPFSNSFQTWTRVELSQVNPSTCRMQVFLKMEFQKSCPWVIKSSIEQGTRVKIRDHYTLLSTVLKKVFSDGLENISNRNVTSSSSTKLEHQSSHLSHDSSISTLHRSPSRKSQREIMDTKELPRVPGTQLLKSWAERLSKNVFSHQENTYIVVVVWVLLSYGLVATLQVKFQLDYLLDKLEDV